MAELIRRRTAPERILSVTFTNKAAREMRERIGGLVGRESAKQLTIGTFHAFCARALREHGEAIGHPANFSICDASDQVGAVRSVLRDLHVPDGTIHPRALQAAISLHKNRLVTAEEAAGRLEADLRGTRILLDAVAAHQVEGSASYTASAVIRPLMFAGPMERH